MVKALDSSSRGLASVSSCCVSRQVTLFDILAVPLFGKLLGQLDNSGGRTSISSRASTYTLRHFMLQKLHFNAGIKHRLQPNPRPVKQPFDYFITPLFDFL